jgi:MSHA biogenesis protein MshP
MKTALLMQPPTKHRQRGVSIISAIFLLLLFAAIAAFMVSMTSTANITSAQDVQGARAYQAAQAGVEWGFYQLDPNGANASLPGCPAVTMPAVVPGFTVTVNCTVYPNAAPAPNCVAPSPTAEFCYQEAGRQVRIFTIVATAAVTGATVPPAAVEREVRITVEKCRDSAIVAVPYDC